MMPADHFWDMVCQELAFTREHMDCREIPTSVLLDAAMREFLRIVVPAGEA